MKNILLLFIAICCLSSCLEDGRQVLKEIDSQVYILKDGLQKIVLDAENPSYKLWIYKGGYNDDEITIRFVIDTDALDEYNTKTGSSYELMPTGYYTLGSPITVNKTSFSGFTTIQFDPSVLPAANYVLPITIVSDKENVINRSKKTVLLNLF